MNEWMDRKADDRIAMPRRPMRRRSGQAWQRAAAGAPRRPCWRRPWRTQTLAPKAGPRAALFRDVAASTVRSELRALREALQSFSLLLGDAALLQALPHLPHLAGRPLLAAPREPRLGCSGRRRAASGRCVARERGLGDEGGLPLLGQLTN